MRAQLRVSMNFLTVPRTFETETSQKSWRVAREADLFAEARRGVVSCVNKEQRDAE